MRKDLDLSGFTGTEHYYRYTRLSVLTDGTKYLADGAKCYWLMDVISSYIPTLPSDEGFAVATLKKHKVGRGAHFELTDDIPATRYYATQEIEYTDFPFDRLGDTFKLYVERFTDTEWCILLTSEH